MYSKDAIGQANAALKAAGIQIDLAPVITDKDETGKTTYTIGGLLITTTQTSPTGSGGTFQITYILGRAKVGAAIANLGFGSSDGSTSAGVDSTNTSSNSGTDSATTDSAASGLDAAALPADIAAAGATVPTNLATITDSGAVAPVVDGTQAAASSDTVKSLGFSAKPGQSGDGSDVLYLMLVLAGVGVLGGHFLFTRFAVAAKGA